MNKLLTIIASVLFFTVSITSLYAKGITFSGTAPTITGTANNDDLNLALKNVFDKMLSDAQNSFSNVKNMPHLLGHMAAANAHVASAATQMNYRSYDFFAITLGTSFAEVGPGDKREIYRDITTKGDAKIGEADQPWALQAGFNAGFLLDGLYLAAKFGKTKNSQTYGILANYDFMKEQILAESIIWRGLKLGTGIIHQQYKTNIFLDSNILYTPTTVDDYTLRMLMRPDLLMKINSNAKVIPVELSTSIGISMLDSLGDFFNSESGINELGCSGCNVFSVLLTAGIGVDISRGNTKVDIENKSLHTFELMGTPVATTVNPGEINVHSDIKRHNQYDFYPKIMLGISFDMFSVITDVSFSIYLNSPGLIANISVGTAF